MKIKNLLFMATVLSTQHMAQCAILKIENNTIFTCEVQPVVDRKDLTTMGSFKYTIRPNTSVSYNSGLYPIVALRWRINLYSADNTQLTRHYYLAEIPKIGITNVNAAIKIGSNGRFQYYQNKSNLQHYIEANAKYHKYIYKYSDKGWIPLQGVTTKTVDKVTTSTAFSFNQELSNDIYR